MSKFYEALQLNGVEVPSNDRKSGTAIPARPTKGIPRSFEEKLLGLYGRIDSELEVDGARVVSIVGLQNVEEPFTYIYEMARLLSTQLRLRVLILCTAESGSHRHLLRDQPSGGGWEDALFDGQAIEGCIHTLSQPPVSISQINSAPEALAGIVTADAFERQLKRLRSEYDLILVDTRPFHAGPDAALMSPVVDGTVLIVDAGDTRWQVISSAAEKVSSYHGRFLGVVLNKRRFYIPNFIYRRL